MTSPTSPESGILKAAHFAADKHRDQRRKGLEASPYINHPIAVAEVLTTIGGVSDLATIQDLLGHSRINTTQRYCQVSNVKVQRDYYKAMDVLLMKSHFHQSKT